MNNNNNKVICTIKYLREREQINRQKYEINAYWFLTKFKFLTVCKIRCA